MNEEYTTYHYINGYKVTYEKVEDGMKIMIHRMKGEKEIVPAGYMYGYNYLHLRDRPL